MENRHAADQPGFANGRSYALKISWFASNFLINMDKNLRTPCDAHGMLRHDMLRYVVESGPQSLSKFNFFKPRSK
jgi:hypothetical protein